MKCRFIATLIILASALPACGVPLNERAQEITDVPFGLLDPQASEPPEANIPTEGTAVQIFLVDSSRTQLIAVERRSAETDLPSVVEALLGGPTRAESRQGLTSAFPDETQVAGVDLVGGVASVDLTADFATTDGPTQRLAIAQMVLTLTGRPGVGRVSFTLVGQPIDIPRGDGTLAAGSVSRDNFREFLPSG
jgi:spore germination protein GerM